MKKTLLATFCTAFAAVALNSCFGGGSNRLAGILDAIPADAEMVGIADLETLMNSAEVKLDGSEIILPQYIKDELPGEAMNEFEDLQDELAKTGLDISAVGIFATFSDDRDCLFAVWPILDEQKFADDMDGSNKMSETHQGVTYYYSESSWDNDIRIECATANGYVYFLESGRYFSDIDEAIDTLEPYFKIEKSYKDTPYGAEMLQGNGGGFAMTMPKEAIRELRREGVPSSIANALDGASLICTMSLSADKLTSSFVAYNAEHKPIGLNDIIGKEIPGLTLEAGIDASMLQYLPQNTIAAYAANVEGTDWDALFDWIAEETDMPRSERGAMTMASSYLNKLGGNIAIGAGFDGGLTQISQLAYGEINPFSVVTFGAVIQTKPDGAKSMIKELCGVLDMAEVPYEETSNGIYVELPEVGKIFANAVENDIIAISNQKITEAHSNAVSGADFGKQIVGGIIVADKNHQVLKDLDINYSLEMVGGYIANPLKGEGELRISDNTDNLVTSIIKTIFHVINNAEKIENEYFKRNYEYDYAEDYYYDEVADEAAPVDYAY